MRVILAEPRGFCAGVERAIDIVEGALSRFGRPVYVRHEIVHNRRVVEELREKGAVFVEELDEIPEGAVTIFSAHGVAQVVADAAGRRALPVIDATCPLVAKVHHEAQRYARQGRQVILIGHRGHPEVEGTSGRVPGGVLLVSTAAEVESLKVKDPDKLAYVTQTTLSVDDTSEVIAALKARFPSINGPSLRDICYATQNRQTTVRKLASEVEVILVVGAQNSSNSNRLREIGEELDVPSHLIDDADAIEPSWFEGVERVGISAGASAPEQLVQEVIQRLRSIGEVEVEALEGVVERVQFKLPPELLADAS
jgi:4-hydroxy-3-methylbut-2-enyl diphosphate reductase